MKTQLQIICFLIFSAAATIRLTGMTAANQTTYVYVNNQLFRTTETVWKNKTNVYTVHNYNGYSADRQMVKKIMTRKPGVVFTNNAHVFGAERQLVPDPDYVITDAIRDVRGTIIQIIDPLGITTVNTPDALARTIDQTRSKNALSLSTQTEYDAHGNVTKTTSETGVVTEMVYDPADNLKTRTVTPSPNAPGPELSPMVWTYTYTIDSRLESVNAPAENPETGQPAIATTTYVYQTCCGFSRGVKNALDNGTIQNQDSVGRTVHSATVEDFDSHVGNLTSPTMLNPQDDKTLSEITTRYYDNGQVHYRTVWKSALGQINRNSPPIAGVDGVLAANGVTTRYLYDSVIYDNADLDSAAGRTITRIDGTSAQVSIKAAYDQSKLPVASGGAGTTFASGSAGKATVAISPDEKTMQVSIADAIGQTVINATMTGPAWVGNPADDEPDNPNELITWSCSRFGTIDDSTMGYPTKLVVSVDPDNYTTKSLINGYGQSVGSIDQDGNLTTSTFDAGGNMLSRTQTVTDSSKTVPWTWKPSTRTTIWAASGLSKIRSTI